VESILAESGEWRQFMSLVQRSRQQVKQSNEEAAVK
jgi:hypothetical protein